MQNKMIYADNAATTHLDQEALEAMLPFLKNQYGNPSSVYAFGKQAKRTIEESRESIAQCIGARPEEIIFTSGGTESDNWALNGGLPKDGGRFVTSVIEHPAILQTADSLVTRRGTIVDYCQVNENGVVRLDEIDALLNKGQVDLCSVMLANNEIGSIQPIEQIAAFCHQYGVLCHTDAVQGVGHIPINVRDLSVDMLSASAHKFNGPRGIGFLYVKNGVMLSPLIYGGGQEKGRRSGTENTASIVGMAVALKNNVEKLEVHQKILVKLEQQLKEKIKYLISDVRFNGDVENKLPGLISVSFKNIRAESLLHLLDLRGICVSAGSACHAGSDKLSHVVEAIQIPLEYQKGTIRISLCADNSEEDIYRIAEQIAWAIKKIKRIKRI